MMYRDWMAWPPALGWEMNTGLHQIFFSESEKVGMPHQPIKCVGLINRVYGPDLNKELRK